MFFSVEGWPLWGLVLLFAAGLILTVKGGDLFVDAAVYFAEVSGVPQFVIGATVVSFATACPELIVSLLSSLQGNSAFAVGNAVGSVTVNTGMILALSMLFAPAVVNRREYASKSVLLILAAAVLLLSCRGTRFSAVGGVFLLLIFAVSVYDSLRACRPGISAAESRRKCRRAELAAAVGKFAAGAAGIVIGADFLVDSAAEAAGQLGVSQAVISATIVAVGTSLPELVTTVTAIVKRQSSLGCGNILGANLIDLAVILPLCAAVSPEGLAVCAQNMYLDLPVCLAVQCAAFLPMLLRGRFSRAQGAILLAVYAAYTVLIAFFNPF